MPADPFPLWRCERCGAVLDNACGLPEQTMIDCAECSQPGDSAWMRRITVREEQGTVEGRPASPPASGDVGGGFVSLAARRAWAEGPGGRIAELEFELAEARAFAQALERELVGDDQGFEAAAADDAGRSEAESLNQTVSRFGGVVADQEDTA